MSDQREIRLIINGTHYTVAVEPRRTLVDVIRDDCGQTGTHIGCEHGVCGACTILLDGEPMRSCLMFAVQADGRRIRTVEGLQQGELLHPIQEAFMRHHGLQCGFCTPGMLMSGYALLQKNPNPTEQDIRWGISGNLCRCTGYQNIVKAVQYAARKLNESGKSVAQGGQK